MSSLEVREREMFAPLEEVAKLPTGAISLLGLRLTDVDFPYDSWEALGQLLGNLRRWTQWALGDWINFGEAVYGEQAAQATEGNPVDRYNIAERVTGLSHRTLVNYASVCSRIALERRRPELDFSVHEPVAALEAEDQVKWLQRAVDEGWTREELRAAIKDEMTPSGAVVPDDDDDGEAPLSRLQQIEQAASLCYHQAQRTSDGGAVVAAEPWAQLESALGH